MVSFSLSNLFQPFLPSIFFPLFSSTNLFGSLSSEEELILPPDSAHRPFESALARASKAWSLSSADAASSESSLRPASSRSLTQPSETASSGSCVLLGRDRMPYSRLAPVGILYRTRKCTTLPTSRRRRKSRDSKAKGYATHRVS